MDAEVFMISEQRQGSFGNAADSGLNSGAIGNERGDVPGYGPVLIGNLVLGVLS
jgi:hypothetical protein